MTLNPGFVTELEACGLTNAALEPLMLLLRLQLSGSVTWHVHGGLLVKCDVHQSASMKQPNELAQTAAWLTTEKPNGKGKLRG
ncbi:MAG TPA: hypothetical protein VF077_12670 [Nitrospiraceae bacterium]